MKPLCKLYYKYCRIKTGLMWIEDLFSKKRYIRERIALNQSIPIDLLSELLTKLSDDKFYEVRRAVAGNTNTPISILEKLSKDKHADVRMRVVYNKNTPIHIIDKLYQDKDHWVRQAVKDRIL